MYNKFDVSSDSVVKEIVDRIIASGYISPKDHTLLTSTVLNDGGINDAERRQLNRIFDYLQTGRLKLVDW